MAKYRLFGKRYKLWIFLLLIASSVGLCSIVLSLIQRGNQPNRLTAKHPISKPSALVGAANHGLSKHVVGLKPETTPELRTFSVPAQFQGKTLSQVKLNNQEKLIALTFDDGPWQKTTLQVLDILKKNNINATFFWVGAALEKNPQIAQQVVADGNAIGNHTWHHWYHHLDKKTAAKEIEDTAQLMYKTTGVKTSLFRPPGGFLKNGVAAYAKQQNYAVVMWSVSSADTDWKAQPSAFVKNVLKGAKPGSIVLMHDGGGEHSKTVKALPEIISGLRQMGYRFVTVPELLKDAKSK
ncbi:polysaccharide deacetylase family protein [Allocoleopsis sp.]|uniref:polysaccharide deacetylase family protein n=1 Tax=Allocoleopsis sp. TaxID=3088169 RepID=UPI002FD2CA2F